MPDFQDFDATVPVIVKDSDRVALTDKVNLSGFLVDKLTVICEISGVDYGEVDVFFQNQHAVCVNVLTFTCFTFGKGLIHRPSDGSGKLCDV